MLGRLGLVHLELDVTGLVDRSGAARRLRQGGGDGEEPKSNSQILKSLLSLLLYDGGQRGFRFQWCGGTRGVGVRHQAAGFRRFVSRDITLEALRTVRIDLRPEVGEVGTSGPTATCATCP